MQSLVYHSWNTSNFVIHNMYLCVEVYYSFGIRVKRAFDELQKNVPKSFIRHANTILLTL